MPGVRPVNMAAFYIAVLFSTLVFAFMTQAQPLLLTTTLGVEAARAGGVGGGIVLWGSWVVILCVGLFGALSDKLGRLPVFALGFLLMGLCCFLHPQAERVGAELGRLLPGEAQLDGVAGLLALRLLYAVGVAAAIAMLPTVLADYAVDSDRGRATGIRTVMGGMGALLATGALLQLPKLLVSLGFDSQAALRFTYQAAAYLIFAVALFLCLFLQRRTLAQAQRRESVWEITREGLRAARDPGVALAYGGAFLARAPLAMFGAFFALWSKQRGLDIGLGPEETSLAFIVAIVFALLGAPIFGLMADRLNRVTALVLACAVAALGYGSTWFIQDPLGLELPRCLWLWRCGRCWCETGWCLCVNSASLWPAEKGVTGTMSQHFLGIRLAPGVQPINLAAFYVAALVGILIFAFMNQAQILLLTPELGVDPKQKGSISGDLVFWGEVVVLGLVGIFGSLSDKIGRLPIFCGGFVFLGLLCFLQPEAGSLNGLLVMRLFYAVGVAAVIGMLPTVLADYAVDADRGRATGIQGVMNGIGAMITVFALLKLPSLLTSLGDDSQTAVRRTYQLVAYLSFAVAIFLALFLQRRAVNQTQRPEGTLLQIAIEGLRAARDPGIALAYGAAFLSRGLLTVLGVFFTVWGEKFGVAAGYTPVDAVARVGLVIGVAQTFALIGAPLFGILADRLNRVTALVLACAVAALGYGSTWFIHDPLGLDLAALLGVVGAAALIGLGEVGCIITSGVLIAQQAPPRVRGAVIGFFNLSGAAGILVASALGGRLFDNWRPSGPFLLFGALALIVAVWGLAVRGRVVPLREPGAPEAG